MPEVSSDDPLDDLAPFPFGIRTFNGLRDMVYERVASLRKSAPEFQFDGEVPRPDSWTQDYFALALFDYIFRGLRGLSTTLAGSWLIVDGFSKTGLILVGVAVFFWVLRWIFHQRALKPSRELVERCEPLPFLVLQAFGPGWNAVDEDAPGPTSFGGHSLYSFDPQMDMAALGRLGAQCYLTKDTHPDDLTAPWDQIQDRLLRDDVGLAVAPSLLLPDAITKMGDVHLVAMEFEREYLPKGYLASQVLFGMAHPQWPERICPLDPRFWFDDRSAPILRVTGGDYHSALAAESERRSASPEEKPEVDQDVSITFPLDALQPDVLQRLESRFKERLKDSGEVLSCQIKEGQAEMRLRGRSSSDMLGDVVDLLYAEDAAKKARIRADMRAYDGRLFVKEYRL